MLTPRWNDQRLLQIDANKEDLQISARHLGPGFSCIYSARFLNEDGSGDVLFVSPIANLSLYSDDSPDISCTDGQDVPCGVEDEWCWEVNALWLPQANEIFRMNRYGTIKQRLTNNEFFEGELAVSPDFRRVVFASNRDGDYDLYIADLNDIDNPKRITNTIGYEGGVQFAPDGRSIAFFAWRPQSAEAQEVYRWLLSYDVTDMQRMDVYVLDLQSGEETLVTNFAALSDLPEVNKTWDVPYFSFAPTGELYIRQDRQFYCLNLSSDATELTEVCERLMDG
ncbi:hypothetical protein M3Y99_00258900 [Aphelenchoides fujianensis]|nr:hypothetical protein M3Y99_00258900 [Aphelenchoides fujianensis]